MGVSMNQGWIPTPAKELDEVYETLGKRQGTPFFGDINQLKGTGAGKLSLPCLSAIRQSGQDLFAKEPQVGPDCTSHAIRNAIDTSRAVDIEIGQPEEWVARGATEYIYGMRGSRSGGMNVGRGVKFLNEFGFLVRKEYDGIDLSRYNYATGDAWGSRGTPSTIKDEAAKFPARYYYNIRTVEEARDGLANGYGIVCGSNYGNSGVRNNYGISPWDSSWNHAMAWGGCDDTGSDLLFLILQSWGLWNRGGTAKNFKMPGGSFLIRSRDAERMIREGECWLVGKVQGIPAQNLPDYGSGAFL